MTELRVVRYSDPLVEPVVEALAGEYRRRYGGDGEMATTDAEQFDPPSGCFVVAIDAGRTVAAGGYRRMADGACEIKRTWTAPDQRRRGLASRVLAALEAAAARAGYGTMRLETGDAQPEALALYGTMRLETGDAQPEALALYSALGYAPIPNYGRYPRARCFEKPLPAASGAAGLPGVGVGD